jgi:D-alanyl-D-alanine carboxypeptidase/D-alanyl-D-alanine-endopeptidase (penicillin-binding protein 4)
VLAAHRADEGFLPASNLKVFTAAVVLESLGPDHRFTTELVHIGEVANGVLHGDVVLCGHGDPTFGVDDPQLREFVDAVGALGVARVDGHVIGDGSWLGEEHFGRGWQWDHLGEAFALPFGGLCCRGNVVGTTPLADPPLFAATLLAGELERAGIAVTGEPGTSAVSPPPGSARGIAVHRSAPLSSLLRTMLGDSDNLQAEQMWRTAARLATGDGGTDAAAAHSMRVLSRLGVDVHDLVMADGCGLSRRNLVRPMQVVAALLAMWRSPHRAVFVDALPLAGVSGTLHERFTGGAAHGRVRAKTGSIARVVCLSGYVPRADAAVPPLVFSVLWNDFTGADDEPKAIVDAFVQELAAAGDAESIRRSP